jgi:23S rRNA pseudouridine1911/1915/1917 synthase
MNLTIDPEVKIKISDMLEAETVAFTIPDQMIGMRTDQALAEIITDLSRTKLTNWLKDGHILINQKAVKAKDKVCGGEKVLISPPLAEERLAFTPENIPLNVIFADSDVIVINKPAGLTVHPGAGNWSGTLLNGLLYHFPEVANLPRAGIVHRLDKDTTGLMVVARSASAQLSLVEQLQQRSVKRIYRAFVEGQPFKEGIINKNIGRDPHNRLKMTTLEHGGKEAITRYRVLHQFTKIAYIECQLETGRTHQIRVHMKDKGHPLLGDPLYGTRKINYALEVLDALKQLNRQALHALKLSFIHPTSGETLSFKSQLPADLRALLAGLQVADGYTLDQYDASDDENWEIIYAYD